VHAFPRSRASVCARALVGAAPRQLAVELDDAAVVRVYDAAPLVAARYVVAHRDRQRARGRRRGRERQREGGESGCECRHPSRDYET
jgi:hypothetical protein